MVIETSNITHMSPEQVVNICHESTAQPSLLMFYFLAIILLGIFGFTIEGIESKKKFYKIWLMFSILVGVVGGILYFMPNIITQNVVEFFKNMF